MLRRIVLASVSVFALSAAASAADMYVPGPAGPGGYKDEPYSYNWSGFYIGASLGGGSQNIDWRYTNPKPANCCAPFSASASEGIVGGQIGYQRQFGAVVLGVEAGGFGRFDGGVASKTGCIAGSTQTCKAEITGGTFTIGPRVGYSVSNWLFYGTGGYASGTQVKSRLVNSNGTDFDTTSQNQDGWFAGGGIDYALTNKWIVGVEYQHVDLGTKLHPSSADGFAPGGINARDIGASEDTVRARLSYKIWDWAYAPLK